MPIKSAVHTFRKGMAKDLDRSLLSNEAYLNAENFRIVTGVGESTGALENIEGNNLINSNVNAICSDGHQIVGSCLIRDTLVLFTTDETNSRIITVGFDQDTETVGTVTTIYDDSLNGGTGTLGFSIDHLIKAIGRYETPNIQKVYWTDGVHNLRYADITKHLTVTGAEYTSDDYMAPEMFEFLPLFTSTKPTLSTITSGHLDGGMVQYAYQLYRLNGAETSISPVSDLIHIVSDNDFKTNTLTYKGDMESIVTGKGCKISIVNSNSGYDRLRLIRVHYASLDAVPSIKVVTEIEISTSPSTIIVTDVGDSVDELTVDQFNIRSTELFACEDIATKNNRLFAANISKSEFNIDAFDPRAIRFKSNQTSYVNVASDFSDWVAQYALDADGVNTFNNTDNDGDSAYEFKYQANGTTIGAEGKNIKIDFETEDIVLDDSNSYTTFSASSDSSSYSNFASPWMDGSLSWQRDEVYRLFVVWENYRGQRSAPQWIIDLRMPSLHDADFANSSSATVFPSVLSDYVTLSGEVHTMILRPRIYFKDMPANATSCQIYRVKRDREDKSVVTQGLAVPSKLDLGVNWPDQVDHVIPTTDGIELIKLVSPEINITKDVTKKSNDYLEYVTHFSSLDTNDEITLYHRRISKLTENTRIPYSANNISTIGDILAVSPAMVNDPSNNVTVDSKIYRNYNQDGTHTYSLGCSGLLISYANTSWAAEGTAFVVANYRSNVFNSQYGGHTYEDRGLNISVPCSDVITTINTWYSIKGGDTFINYFDVSTILVDLVVDRPSASVNETVYVPLESSVNCDLRYDTSSTHITNSIPLAILRQENAGVQQSMIDFGPMQLTGIYEQKYNLYSYNTVYSQQISVQNAISETIDTSKETSFDCLIKASGVKYNGENSDSWTNFGINEEIEVDSSYGAVTAIHNFNDRLMFWQEHGFGILAVNDRSLINAGSSSQLVLGTGGVLDRYDYISTITGTNDKFTLIVSQSGIYWFDPTDKSVYRFSDSLANISKNKLVQSWFNNNYVSTHFVHGIYDKKYNEVIMSLYDATGTNYTIVFNEATDAYSAFYSFVPRMYVPYIVNYFTTYFTSNADSLYYHNSLLAERCTFYDTLYDSTIKLLFNEDYGYTKAFDNLFYASTTYNTVGYEQHTTSFSSIRCYNTLQNTGYVTLTYGTNLERREREWELAIPRNAIDVTFPTNVDVLDAANLDTTRLYRDRMRDKYLIVDLVYTNTAGNRFIFPYFGLKYRLSYR